MITYQHIVKDKEIQVIQLDRFRPYRIVRDVKTSETFTISDMEFYSNYIHKGEPLDSKTMNLFEETK